MTTAETYIAYAPRGVGLMCAVVYLKRGDDVYGWWTGALNSDFNAAYFKLENFFSAEDTLFFATEGSDLYGGWKYLYSSRNPQLDKPMPLVEEISHELDLTQEVFVREWLYFEDDAESAKEMGAYREAELAVQRVNIKIRQLNKLDKSSPVWVFRSHGLEWTIIEYLGRHWPLDHRPQ